MKEIKKKQRGLQINQQQAQFQFVERITKKEQYQQQLKELQDSLQLLLQRVDLAMGSDFYYDGE